MRHKRYRRRGEITRECGKLRLYWRATPMITGILGRQSACCLSDSDSINLKMLRLIWRSPCVTIGGFSSLW